MKFRNIIKHNKIKAAEQPTTPKPTTTLPDNMTWAWDPKANQWIAVMKDNPVVTPPTYNPNNITNTSNYTSTTYTPIKATRSKKEVKSSADSYNIIMKAKKISDEFYGNNDSKIDYMLIFKLNEDETDIVNTKVIKKKEAPFYSINPHEYFLYMGRDTGWNEIDYEMHPTSELKRYYGNEEQKKEWYKNFNKQSTLIDSLNQFLDGDRYSREIKIEKGLISGGLIRLAGINPIKGPKYSITEKGLELLKQAAQEEYDFEKGYVNARKSYLLDGITESEFKTGAPETQGKMPKFSIFEKDGSELAQIEAKNSTDAKVKFFMENPEYEGSQTIEVKEVKAEDYKLPSTYIDNELTQYHIEKFPSGKWYYWFNNPHSKKREQVGPYKTHDEAVRFLKKHHTDISNPFNEDCLKEIDSTYSETTTQGLDFPNQSVSPSTDIKVNPNGWVNMAADENIDKKQTILKNLVYQHNKQNGEESAIGLSLDFDNKAVATGDLESLSKLEDQLREQEIHCNITPRKDFPEMYELTVFYNTKGAPTDKFAALKKKASEPLKFVSSKNIDFYIEEKDTLVKLVSEKLGIELDPKRIDFDYSLNYNLNSEIEWNISFETREYGIKNMNINILNSTINLEVEYKPNNESAPIQENKFIRIDYPLENVEIIRGDDEIYNSIWLKKIEIKDGYCEVTF